MKSIDATLGLDPSLYYSGSMPLSIDPYQQLEDLGVNVGSPIADPYAMLEEYGKKVLNNPPKLINEVNPDVLINEALQYQEEVKAYEQKQREIERNANDTKIKYKKTPVAEMRGEIYRDNKNQDNTAVILGILGAAAGLGAIGYANRRAIGKGVNRVGEYIQTKAKQNTDSDSNPTGHYYIRDTSIFSPEYNKWKKKEGHNSSILTTPMESMGEMAARLAYDVSTHGTQRYLWMIHPLDLMGKLGKQGIDIGKKLGAPGQALLLGAALQPAIIASGAYDITNPSELFRPQGFKQNSPDPEDPRQTNAPAEELFHRFMLGRTGRPLKYSAAKEEIPDLTPGRYKDFMNYIYRDKGLLNLGLVKATDENLQGIPEARILGYPVTLDSVGTFAGGILGANLGIQLANNMINPGGDASSKPVSSMSVDELATKITNQKLEQRKTPPPRPEPGSTKPSTAQTIAQQIDDESGGFTVKKADPRYLAGGMAGVALGSLAGHFLSKYVQDQIKKGNDEKRAAEEYAENGYRPRGYYMTDGNNNPIVL